MLLVFVLIILFIIFRPWLGTSGTLSAGDWPYLFREQIAAFHWLPEARFLWLAPYYQIVTKIVVGYLGVPWNIAERLLWFWPWILISFFSAKKFTKSPLGGLIYTTNTYALMLVGGGQMGVAMAYALAPLVFVSPWVLPIQVMFDPRIALLTFAAVVWKNPKRFIVPAVVTIFIHSYWWIPLWRNPSVLATQFQQATSAAVKYLSFSSLPNSMSLTHPNWPENIFGKVYFQRPEFLIIPLVAFASLLVKPNIYFGLLALVGAFLAKGSNEPFGGVYLWLFDHVPGFSLFRDPTKFYLFVALGYSYLISRFKQRIFVVMFLLFWAFTLREAILGKLTGTFAPVEVPKEYQLLRDSATAWYPKKSRFSFAGSDFASLENVHYVVVPTDVRGEIFVTDRTYDETKHQEAIQFVATMSGLRRVDKFKDLAVFEKL